MRECTYRELWDLVETISCVFPGSPGDRIALVMPGDDRFISLFLGAMHKGLIPVPVPFPLTGMSAIERFKTIVRDAGPAVIVAAPAILDRLAGEIPARPDGPAPHLVSRDSILSASAGSDEPWPARGDDPAFIQYTSGSTGSPKGVLNTHRALLYQSEYISKGLEVGQVPQMVSWLPLSHDMGLIYGCLDPLLTQGTTTLMLPSAFIADPLRWILALSDFRATFTASPDFGCALAASAIVKRPGLEVDLSALHCALNASDPISPDGLAFFRRVAVGLGMDGRAVTPAYGLAEASLAVCAAPGLGPQAAAQPVTRFDSAALGRSRAVVVGADDAGRELVGLGAYRLDTRVGIVDPASREPLEQGRVGEVWLAGPGLPPGYWHNDGATEEIFHARRAGDDDRTDWLRTGDLGFFHEGSLYLAGCLKDLIIWRGENIYPQDAERTLRGLKETRTRRLCVGQREHDGAPRRRALSAPSRSPAVISMWWSIRMRRLRSSRGLSFCGSRRAGRRRAVAADQDRVMKTEVGKKAGHDDRHRLGQ